MKRTTRPRITIVSPRAASRRTGNLHTAARYAEFLRAMGAFVRITDEWSGERADVLIVLHAKKSSKSARAFKAAHSDHPLIVVLTGTDLYRDLARSRDAQRALDLASAIIALQPDALRFLRPAWRKKATPIVQSAVASKAARKAHGALRVAVLGHLRAEKDPLRAAAALELLPSAMPVRVTQAGAALQATYAAQAQRIQAREPRYRYLGEVSKTRAATLLRASDVMVISSRMEGGANVVSEAIAAGIPVIASRISGNIGMLGRNYSGYFPVGDSHSLARLLERCATDASFVRKLRAEVAKLRPCVAPKRERQLLQHLVRRLLTC